MQDIDTPYQGRIIGQGSHAEHRFAVRVYYEDTDFSGIVYHARYLHFCERGRTDFLARLGLDQRALHEMGEGAFAVTEMNCQFRAPAHFDDALIISTIIGEKAAASFRLIQKITRKNALIFEANVRIAFLSPNGRPKRLPAAWHKAIETI